MFSWAHGNGLWIDGNQKHTLCVIQTIKCKFRTQDNWIWSRETTSVLLMSLTNPSAREVRRGKEVSVRLTSLYLLVKIRSFWFLTSKYKKVSRADTSPFRLSLHRPSRISEFHFRPEFNLRSRIESFFAHPSDQLIFSHSAKVAKKKFNKKSNWRAASEASALLSSDGTRWASFQEVPIDFYACKGKLA